MRTLCVLIITLLLSLNEAFAGYLTIGGSSEFTTEVRDSKVILSGRYLINNSGDEAAHKVFPSFRIGDWTYSGEPKLVGVNATEVWEVRAEFELSLLRGEGSAPSAIKGTVTKGMYPLLVRRHYEDSNGAKFSSADVELIAIGQLTDGELGFVRTPRLTPLTTCDGNGERFTCKLEILNTSEKSFSVMTSYHTTMELKGLTRPAVMEVPPGDQRDWSFQLKNFSGLAGSSYGVFAVIEWEDGGLHFSDRAGAVVAVQRVSYRNYFIAGGIALSLIAALSLYVFVFREKAAK